MSQPIANSIAFVTGANRGIGAALVDALIARGASKVYAAARSLATLDTVVSRSDGRVVPVALDVTQLDSIRAAATLAGDTTLLINNAGIVAGMRPIQDVAALDDLRQEFEVNTIGMHAVTQAFAPALLAASGSRTLVNVASVVSLASYPLVPTYSASKAAAHSLTQSWRHALTPHGIHVLGVYPGPVDTDMGRDLPIEKASVHEVANAILDGIEAGQQEILPDVVARDHGTRFLSNPKALELHVSGQVAQMTEGAAA